MALIVSIIGITFAAFCVWLGVRIVNRRERWAKWTLAGVLGLPILNVLSFGPACWWFSRERGLSAPGEVTSWIGAAYVPCGRLAMFGPPIIGDPLIWYASLGADDSKGYVIPTAWHYWAVEKM
jgi:hypothetical protein